MRVQLAAFAVMLLCVACGDDRLIPIEHPAPQRQPTVEDPPADPPADPAPPDPEPAPPPTSGSDCSDDSDCGAGSECAAGTCVGVGVLQITLTFPVDADYDLHVITPSFDEIYYANPSADGGVLDVDQCIISCGSGTHVENIFFNGALQSGQYMAYAVNFDGRSGGNFHIQVSGRTTASLDGNLVAYPDEISDDLYFQVQ